MKNPYYLIPYEVREKLNPRQWLREFKWARQRVSRGWSDRDTWGAGDHIAKITAEMLQHLNDYTYIDWPEWFKLNVEEDGKGSYKKLQDVVDDINNYLVFSETSWADGLTSTGSLKDMFGEPDKDGNRQYKGSHWVNDDTGKRITEAEVSRRIKVWHNKQTKLYDKAQKAMMFFGRHFTQFWD